MAKIAKSYDPKWTTQSVDHKMTSRGPRYRELFKQWHLSENEVGQVLAIIRERETDTLNEMIRRARETSTEVGDHSDMSRIKASFDKAISKKQSVLLAAEARLLPILGTERFLQLQALEKKIVAEDLARAKADTAD